MPTEEPRRQLTEDKIRAVLDKSASDLAVAAATEPAARMTAHPRSLASQTDKQPRFEDLAQQLLPDDRPMSQSLQVWLGQLVFRIQAAANGIRRVYPGEEQSVMALAEAVKRRYQTVSVGFNGDPLDQAVVQVNPESDPHAIEKHKIMRDLDTLLGRIAFKSVDPEATLRELADIIRRAHETLQTE